MFGSLLFFQFDRILTTFRAKKVVTFGNFFGIIDSQVELKPETAPIGSGNIPVRVQLFDLVRSYRADPFITEGEHYSGSS